MHIAIVDDDKSELNAAKFYLSEFIQENYPELEVNIQTFSAANDFFTPLSPDYSNWLYLIF